MRRISALVLVLVLALPLAAGAGGAEGDPYGGASTGDLTAPGPTVGDWLGSIFRVLVVWLSV